MCSNVKKYKQLFKDSWLEKLDCHGDTIKQWATKLDEEHIFCKLCSRSIQISTAGFSSISKHASASKHVKARNANSSTTDIRSAFTSVNSDDAVTDAELKWVAFLNEHNIPFAVSDHAAKLFQSMFPNCNVAQKIAVCRTKATYLTTYALAKDVKEKVTAAVQVVPFGVEVDESNNRAVAKQFDIHVST